MERETQIVDKKIQDVKNYDREDKVEIDVEEKQIEALEDGKVTQVVTFSNKTDSIVIETVASFWNMFNYVNTPTTKVRVLKEGAHEILTINYTAETSPVIELIKSQTLKLILDGKEKQVEIESILEFFSRNPDLFKKIFNSILENSRISEKVGLLKV